MRITLDTGRAIAEVDGREYPLYSPEAFEILSRQWLALGWNQEHWASFSWMGRRMLQFPDDVLRLGEAIWNLRPDVIIEAGVFDGGLTLFFATLCRMAGHGRVIAVDKQLRAEVRTALEPFAVLVEGDSADAGIRRLVATHERAFVFLDSDHSTAHVRAELENYAPVASWLVVADSILPQLAATPNGESRWLRDNPKAAVEEFLQHHAEFEPMPPHPFAALSYFPNTWIQRRPR